jgi:hypothetical protein
MWCNPFVVSVPSKKITGFCNGAGDGKKLTIDLKLVVSIHDGWR